MTKLMSWFFPKHIEIKTYAVPATLPLFPQFKKLQLSDKEPIEKITSKYPPYSDFNFVSMWSWDTKKEMRVSQLNGNLVVRFTDYITGEPFYSFLGNNEINDTAEKLLELSKKEGLKPELKLIPEDSIKDINVLKFNIKEERDNFDYIYKNENLSDFSGSEFKDKRYLLNKFKNTYNANTVISGTINAKDIKAILKLDRKWAKCKAKKETSIDIKNEIEATRKFFSSLSDFTNAFLFLRVYVGKKLVGFSINSIISEDYALCHFSKGDIEYVGIYEYLFNNYGQHLASVAHYMNYEQDLGFPSLRFSKNSFHPKYFLKKYVIMGL